MRPRAERRRGLRDKPCAVALRQPKGERAQLQRVGRQECDIAWGKKWAHNVSRK